MEEKSAFGAAEDRPGLSQSLSVGLSYGPRGTFGNVRRHLSLSACEECEFSWHLVAAPPGSTGLVNKLRFSTPISLSLSPYPPLPLSFPISPAPPIWPTAPLSAFPPPPAPTHPTALTAPPPPISHGRRSLRPLRPRPLSFTPLHACLSPHHILLLVFVRLYFRSPLCYL